MDNLDEILKTSLAENEPLNDHLKQQILFEIRQTARKEQEQKKLLSYSIFPCVQFRRTALFVFCALLIIALSAFAALRYLSTREVAEKLGNEKLAEIFGSESGEFAPEVQTAGGYMVTLHGLVSGEEISDWQFVSNEEIITDKTYAVITIEKADGTPMPGTLDDAYDDEQFLVSPYISGYDPKWVNMFSLRGGYYAFVENGVHYRLMDTRNIEVFADHTLYIGVSEGTFYNLDAYLFDPETGEISRNESFDGLNALFTLSIDPAKADSEKANEIIQRIDL